MPVLESWKAGAPVLPKTRITTNLQNSVNGLGFRYLSLHFFSAQNLARNGATSRDTLEYMQSLSRNPHEDHPALVIYSMVGNDVCNEQVRPCLYQIILNHQIYLVGL